jgi:AraC-like DNA-binding protein
MSRLAPRAWPTQPAMGNAMDRHPELISLIERFARSDGVNETAIPRLAVMRMPQPTEPMHGVHEPAVCFIAQGAKRVLLGEQVYRYDPGNYLVVSVDVPIVGQVIEASAEAPYLGVKLDIDAATVGALMMEAGIPATPSQSSVSSLLLGTVTPDLTDAVVRLMRLLETPRDIPILAPLIEREILYRLLLGEQTAQLRQIALADSKLHQVNRAIQWIKRNFTEPFSIEAVAAEARMSASALHLHFKAVTAMSPLQYQKQLRLQEARRLILVNAVDAATAGHRVGYDSPSQFSREYSRLFGAPPIRDIARLRTAPEMMAQG